MSESCALVVVAGGSVYEDYAAALMKSAREFFHPTPIVEYLVLSGDAGWPIGTLCRHERLLANLPQTDFVYLVDADARFEEPVGAEILPPGGKGVVATRHPGYVTAPAHELPYERDPASSCALRDDEGGTYYCGGWFGGDRRSVRELLVRTVAMLDIDAAYGHVPRFHDESALNCVLAFRPPALTLDPDFAHPDNDSYYLGFWPTAWSRKLVMLDKAAHERGDR